MITIHGKHDPKNKKKKKKPNKKLHNQISFTPPANLLS